MCERVRAPASVQYIQEVQVSQLTSLVHQGVRSMYLEQEVAKEIRMLKPG